MNTVSELPIASSRALIHEQGWPSWSPTTTSPVGTRAHRPASAQNRVVSSRPDVR
jgi:alpha-galactosidase